MKIIKKPVFELKINRAVFINQDLVVYTYEKIPYNLIEAVKFLFGEDARVTLDDSANYGCIKITDANYVLENIKTLDADFLVTKKE